MLWAHSITEWRWAFMDVGILFSASFTLAHQHKPVWATMGGLIWYSHFSQSCPPWGYFDEIRFSASTPFLASCISSVLLIQNVLMQKESSREKLQSNLVTSHGVGFPLVCTDKWPFSSAEETTVHLCLDPPRLFSSEEDRVEKIPFFSRKYFVAPLLES